MREFSKFFGPDTGVKTSAGGNYYSCLETAWQFAFEIIQREIESGSTIEEVKCFIDEELEDTQKVDWSGW